MADNAKLNIEVAYATVQRQVVIKLAVGAGMTLIEALLLSGIQNEFPEVDFETATKGIFSKIEGNDYVLQDNDRVEIYRPLRITPRQARSRRAAKGTKR